MTAPADVYTLSLPDALPISSRPCGRPWTTRWPPSSSSRWPATWGIPPADGFLQGLRQRSEEHTSELQSRRDLVCRLLLEKHRFMPVNAALVVIQRSIDPLDN